MTERSVVPVACSLRPVDVPDRRAAWEELLDEAMLRCDPTPQGVRLRFAPDARIEQRLRELARLEEECCSFATWEVHLGGEDLVLSVDAAGEGVAAVRIMFERPLGAEAAP
ncbi:MAG: hypothetical protein M3Z95_00985 [Actinomycetota bacterium]|nr:hypothetical protein [Actinomycetota bacterium]